MSHPIHAVNQGTQYGYSFIGCLFGYKSYDGVDTVVGTVNIDTPTYCIIQGQVGVDTLSSLRIFYEDLLDGCFEDFARLLLNDRRSP